MTFENPNMTSSQLPDPTEIDFERLDKHYLWSVILRFVLTALMFAGVLSITRFQPFLPTPSLVLQFYLPILFTIVFLVLIVSSYQFLAIPCKKYCLREHDLHYCSGLIFRTIVSQPIIRIQHVELKTGPIERIFNLSTLQVYSAGGTNFTFEIPGLSQQTANRIKHFVLTHKDTLLDG